MAKLYNDFNILVFVGERLIQFARGELSFIEQFRENNMLEHFYRNTYGSHEYNTYLGRIVKQIAHRYQHMNILEIGKLPFWKHSNSLMLNKFRRWYWKFDSACTKSHWGQLLVLHIYRYLSWLL